MPLLLLAFLLPNSEIYSKGADTAMGKGGRLELNRTLKIRQLFRSNNSAFIES